MKTWAPTAVGRLVAGCLLLCAVALALPAAALAQDIPRLQDQVTDLTRTQLLAGGTPRIRTALAELRETRNIQLFVLFAESTGARTVTEYADEVARRSSLGGNDALLVVAVGDRSDALWRGSLLRDGLTDRELEMVLSERVEPLLARGDFAGAVVAGAEGIAEVAATDGAGSGQPGVGGSGLALVPILLAVLLVVGGLYAWNALAKRRRERRAAEEGARQTEQLAQEANALLIQTDEALRDAEDEIGFAEAQFGAAEVAPYREAVARASDELKAAFTLRQQLDDVIPETPDVRRQLVEQIVAHARRAQVALDEQRQRIEQLRDLERRAPEILAGLPGQLDALEASIPAAERTLSGLERYARPTWASVAENADEARERVAVARSAVSEGRAALGAGDRTAAGRQARAAQQALAEARQRLEAVDSLARSLREAEVAAAPQVAAAASDVRAARAALAGRADADLARRLAEAEGALSRAERELTADAPDFLAATRLATQADSLADQILAEVRQDEERRAREARILAAQLQAAEASYRRAADFIAARRRRTGWAARTRLTEARRHLDQARALAGGEPQAALAEARRAQERAEQAFAAALQDAGAADPFGGWGGVSRGGTIPFPIPFPMPTGGWGGGRRGGGWGGGGLGSGGGGGSVGGRW